MHHHHPFIISSIAAALQKELKDNFLVKCFSNSIDEIYFEFDKFAFRCIFYKGELFFSFDNVLVGENRLFKPQFKEIVNSEVLAVKAHPYERSFHIEFNNNLKLVFKCFGRKSNILLFKEDTVSDIFRKHIESDNDLQWERLFRNERTEFEEKDFDSETRFTKQYPYLSSQFYNEIKHSVSKENFNALIHQYNNSEALTFNEDTLELSINFNSKDNNVLSTITTFTALYLKTKTFSEQKNELILNFSTQIKEKENYLRSNSVALENLTNSRKEEEIGNIILANLHEIKEGVKKITVNDVYHNVPIEIKLDEKLSAIKNAESFFRKDKAKPFIIKQLESKISNSIKEIEKLKNNLAFAENATRIKDLKPIINHKSNQKENSNLPYKYFKIEDYDIMVGKHAESNEKLLNYFSDKDDWWLHAKDVGGSHVIIKAKKNKLLPDTILEKAAALAAYFSKSRNQSLATVIYTQRKFVRKIKGADKGKVTVSNEKSILVKPEVYKV